jgi:hypothetical protein
MFRFFALLCLFAIIVMTSCGQKYEDRTPIPPGVLDEEAFARLLVNIAVTESAANLNIRGMPIQKFDSAYAFDPLSEQGVRKATYDSTIRFYSAHPEKYKRVYDSVLVHLTDLKTKRSTTVIPDSSSE